MAVEDASGAPRELVPGEGNIRARTIRLGHVILAVDNVASIALTVRPRNIWPIIYASILTGAIIAAGVHGINLDYVMSGSVFLIVVGAGVAIAARWPQKSVLAVETNSGRTYYVGSGNKEFLIRLGELLRRKIDSADPELTGEFSAEEGLVTTAPALGPRPAPERIAPPRSSERP